MISFSYFQRHFETNELIVFFVFFIFTVCSQKMNDHLSTTSDFVFRGEKRMAIGVIL